MSSILFIQNISLIKSYFVHVNQRDTHFSAIFFTQLLLCEIHHRGIKEPFHGFSFFIPSHLFINQRNRIKDCFESRERNQVLFFFFEFQRNEIRESKNTTRLSIQVCKRGAQPQDNINTERKREREYNQSIKIKRYRYQHV